MRGCLSRGSANAPRIEVPRREPVVQNFRVHDPFLCSSIKYLVGVYDNLKCGKMADFDLSTSFIPSLHKPSSLLPIARHRQSLLYLVETFPVTIVVGQTGL